MKRLFQKLKFEVIPAILKKGQRLIDALKTIGYKDIPSNVILDKTLTGIGATYQELHAKRHSIIIEPTLPVNTIKRTAKMRYCQFMKIVKFLT